MPRIIPCDQHTSQARYLTASVDPAITYTNNPAGPTSKVGMRGRDFPLHALTHSCSSQKGEAIFTEDVNLSVFMTHLKKLCVST